MKALLLGAGASYELGLPLVWELTAEVKNWLTPEKMDWLNALLATFAIFSAAIAVFASEASGISTKAKPFDRPVSWSKMRVHSVTEPCSEKSLRMSCSVVVRARLRTKSFIVVR